MGDLSNLSPGMRQYMEVKEKHPDCIVLFRMGDFYETFYQDAKTAARELDITLTSRGKGEKKAPLAGIPYHAATPYVTKLVKKGYKVCIVEQIEDPKKAKGLVKRDVVRIVTPGTLTEELMLTASNNYIMAINKEKDQVAVALSDVSTGEFSVFQVSPERLESELNKYHPSEIILPLSLENSEFVKSLRPYFINFYDDLYFFEDKAMKTLQENFQSIPSLSVLQQTSAGALISYIRDTQRSSINHINRINIINTDDFMLLDKVTLSNLNILHDNKNKASLLDCLDSTKTSMGSRLLRNWILKPLTDINKINLRLDATQELVNNLIIKDEIADILKNIQDIDRLISRVSFKNATPKDLVALRSTLHEFPRLNSIKTESTLLSTKLDTFPDLLQLLESAIKDEPNTLLREGNIIRKGYSEELDELRGIKSNSRQWLVNFETKEKERTGIKFLKVRYNKVFGYFIEISKSQLSMVPDNYIRKQTQVNCERFITNELKEKENIILNADERIHELEYNLFMELLEKISKHIRPLQEASSQIAMIDVMQSFADKALLNRYVRPQVTQSYDLKIESGRHPIVEQLEESFISNYLDLSEETRMMIITGPNMAGKSVYIKQNALIVLMAQMGSFVPADKALIGIVDRIFSRVGASDDISSGHSTFMVEMNETANILNNATERSFIILDEIGRGTSTYDGVSLAWAIAEYIITKIKAKTLFATHYHHLNKMADQYPGIRNFNIAVSEKPDEIIFLRKIIEGGTDKSYGIHVAKIAGLPTEVIDSSKRIITQLEMEDEIGDMLHKNLKNKKIITKEDKEQLQKTLLDL
ncbi:DNA mismatch repair protein MutS [Candidatus Woesearchaeota archaeon]|nr:DNA mismatch repair protein MutS [Candidatus Woesearchaeota archaeon]